MGGGGPAGGMGMSRPPKGLPGNKEPDFKQLATIACVTTAFLDAVTKSDASARQWLTTKADRWLGKSATLKIK